MGGVRSLRAICVGALIGVGLVVAGCAPASQEHFQTLGNAICTNTAKAIASQAAAIDAGKAEGDAAALISLEVIKAHRQEAAAFGSLTPPAHLQAAWDATIEHITTTADLASDRLAGRDVDANVLHADHQAQFHLTMSALGLDVCANRGDEWPGQPGPVGGGAHTPGSAKAGQLLPGVVIDGYSTAPDPATVRERPADQITP